MELSQTTFSKCPKRFDTINVAFTINKLISSMVNSIMLFITKIYKSVIAAPSIRIDRAITINTTAYNRLQSGFSAFRDDFSVYFTATFEDAKDRRFLYVPRPLLPLILLPPKYD